MRFVFKILAFIALLLISKLTRQDTLVTTPAESPQVIVNTQHSTVQKASATLTVGQMYKEASLPHNTVQAVVATPATIK
ncbi:hypothetical protein [Pontibacter fetidus]|uniref:TonB-dependent receptor n=1 Tax=Pontibacter fetidus TaxID=2700082 RepID=A0A6B2H6N5_9BACT|nr:hypothetical protein [Pontibacter fetidus]NDK54704.1 hypothetical protein [Pontibacter fetidus]